MAMPEDTRDSVYGHTQTKALGCIAILAGVTFILHICVLLGLPSINTFHEITAYRSHQTVYALLAISMIVFVWFAVAFLAGLRGILGQRSMLVASAGVTTLAVGLLVQAIGVVAEVAAFHAVSEIPARSSYAAESTFSGPFITNLQTSIGTCGSVLVGVGFLLVGWTSWRQATVPRWLSVVAVLGGLGGVAQVATGAAGIAYLAFLIWAFTLGVRLVRAKGVPLDSQQPGHRGSSGI